MPRPKKPVSSTRVTRPCTKVYYRNIPPDEEVCLEIRPYDTVTEYAARPFKSNPDVHLDDVEDMLKAKQEELLLLKRANAPVILPLRRATKLTWKSRVDCKRAQVADMLRHQVKINFAEVCRALKCSYSLVKRVHQELLMQGEHSDFQPQNLKPPQDIQQLVESVSQVQGTYTTIGDLK